ncbi:MAG: hypothetical protein KJO55_08790 [Gammaproteobacteria bacterium]|nr:hypothetical protein [Gammaproteobacteria bacterium]
MRTNPRSLIALLLILLFAPAMAQQDSAVALELRLDPGLSELSYQRLEDGSAAAQPVPEPVPEPVSRPPLQSPQLPLSLPVLLAAAVILALLAFSLGLLLARRRLVEAGQAAAPVQLWNDSDSLESEVGDLREQLAEQQLLNESLQTAHEQQAEELHNLREERNSALTESQVLRMRHDDGELGEAHALIDELRSEIEKLRGAESDLEHDPRTLPAADDNEELLREIEKRDSHIVELESLMTTVREEREELQQLLESRDVQLEAIEHTVGDRDRVIETLQQQQKEQLDKQRQLEAETQRLQKDLEQHAAAAGSLLALEEKLSQATAQSGIDQAALDERQRIIEELQDRLNQRDTAAAQVHELEERKDELEAELSTRREELIMLAEQNDRLQARLYEFEQVLKQDEDLTTQMELGSPAVTQETPVMALRAAEAQITGLREQLEAAQQRLADQADVDVADLQRQNVKLSAMVIQRDNMVEELEQQLAQSGKPAEEIDEGAQDWTSTVSSLENEIRRKTSLIDNHADRLHAAEAQKIELGEQLANVAEKLEASREEVVATQAQLAETRALAASLREELETLQHAEQRLRLAQNPADDPFSQHVDAIDPVEADIETLRFTVRSREYLVGSLQAILDEESTALDGANKRASAREELLVSLENEIAANRITIAALQNRVSHARASGAAGQVVPGPQVQRLERELQRSVRVNEKLRTDLHKWRRRVKPLHDAVVGRDTLIKNLRLEVEALRNVSLRGIVRETGEYDETMELGSKKEREACFRTIAELWEQIEKLENRLAETGLDLSRALALDETRVAEIENLEAARSAQILRIDELHHELMTLGVASTPAAEDDNVVELQAHRPSS